MAAEVTEFLKTQIYPRIDKRSFLSELNPREMGRVVNVTCPECGKPEAYVFRDGGQIMCRRADKCAASVSLWDYLQKRNGLTQRETLERLAGAAGVALPKEEMDFPRYEAERKKRGLLDDALAYFKRALWGPEGVDALAYLWERGYNDDEIKAMELGTCPGKARTWAALKEKGHSPEDFRAALGFLADGHREAYKITFPFRDQGGGLVVIWGRCAQPDAKERKYLPLGAAEGTKGSLPFNFHALPYGGRAVIVEGYFDALAATVKGIPGAIATGGSVLTEGQAEALKGRGVSRAVICLDADKAGVKGAEKSIDRLNAAGIFAFVAELPEGTDPDDIITRGDGAEVFLSLLDHAPSCHRWKARQILQRHPVDTDQGKAAAVKEAFDYAEKSNSALAADAISTEIAQGLGISSAGLRKELLAYVQGKARDAYRKGIEEAIRDATRLKEQGEEETAAQDLEERLKILRLELSRSRAAGSVPLIDFLEQKRARDAARNGSGLLGYKLGRFPSIERATDGIQPGFYLIGAGTNVGKTAFLTNLLRSLLESNDETRGMYFSLDDSREVIINRLLSMLSGLEINEVQKLPSTAEGQQALEKAYRVLNGWARDGRLEIKDISEVQSVSTLEAEIRQGAAGGGLVVAVDGLYNLEVGRYGSIREENVARANKVKALVDTYRIPVITTGELRKRGNEQSREKAPTVDDFMESGKFAYNANLVWLLYPENYEEFGSQDEPKIKVRFEKNKLSHFKGTLDFEFVRKCGVLRDPEATTRRY